MDVEITFIITGIDADINQDKLVDPPKFWSRSFWVSATSCSVVGCVQTAEGHRCKVMCFNSGTEHFHSQLLDTEVLHGVTRGNGPRLTGGPPFERLEVNEKQMSSIKIIPL